LERSHSLQNVIRNSGALPHLTMLFNVGYIKLTARLLSTVEYNLYFEA